MKFPFVALLLGLLLGSDGFAGPSPRTQQTEEKAEQTFAFPSAPAEMKADLRGAFLRTEPAKSESGSLARAEVWVFTKSGRFSKSPQGGFDVDDLETATLARRSEGTYWVDDDKVVLAWADGSKPTEFALERRGDDLVIGPIGSTPSAPRITLQRRGGRELVIEGIISTPLEGFKRGWRFEGDYEKSTANAGSDITNWESATLRKDGTFVLRSQNNAAEKIVGTYEFDKNTLTLKDSNNGDTQRLTVFASGQRDNAGGPELIWCDGEIWVRSGAGAR